MAIKVIKDGSTVITKLNCIKAIITGIIIRGTYVSYELSYFDGMKHCTEWLTEKEFEIDHTETQKLEFRK